MTDFERAGEASRAAADQLRRAAKSLQNAIGSIDRLETQLYDAFRDAGPLNDMAMELALDPALTPPDPATLEQPGQSFEEIAAQREAEWQRRGSLGEKIGDVRRQAESLNEQLLVAQRTLDGPDSDAVPLVALPELATADRALTIADNALSDLRNIPGHDARTVDTLQERASLLRNVVDQSRDILQTVRPKLENARADVTRLSRSDYLSTEQSPAQLARNIKDIATSVTKDLYMAGREMARTEGRLDVAQKPARDAAHGSADLAAMKGFNPPVPEDRRIDASSTGGAAATPGGRERPGQGAAHEV